MKKYIALLLLIGVFSCSKAEDCDYLIDEVYRKYHTLIVKEKLGHNNPKTIRLLEERRDREALTVCN